MSSKRLPKMPELPKSPKLEIQIRSPTKGVMGSRSSTKAACYSASDIRRSSDGLCFSFLTRLGLSTRFTDGTLPIAARDIVLTAVVALKVFFFLFFGMAKEI
jgi:hypothetical protein